MNKTQSKIYKTIATSSNGVPVSYVTRTLPEQKAFNQLVEKGILEVKKVSQGSSEWEVAVVKDAR